MSCSWTGLASIWRCYTVIVVWYFENGGATNSIQLLLSIRSDNTGLWRALFNFICISYMISRLADNSSRPSVPCDNCNAFMGCLKTFEKLLLQFWLTSQSFLKLKPQGFIPQFVATTLEKWKGIEQQILGGVCALCNNLSLLCTSGAKTGC